MQARGGFSDLFDSVDDGTLAERAGGCGSGKSIRRSPRRRFITGRQTHGSARLSWIAQLFVGAQSPDCTDGCGVQEPTSACFCVNGLQSFWGDFSADVSSWLRRR